MTNPVRIQPLPASMETPTVRLGAALPTCRLDPERLVYGLARGLTLTAYADERLPGELWVVAADLYLFGEMVRDRLAREAA